MHITPTPLISSIHPTHPSIHRSMLNNKIPKSRVKDIITEAVDIEVEFICEVGRVLRLTGALGWYGAELVCGVERACDLMPPPAAELLLGAFLLPN